VARAATATLDTIAEEEGKEVSPSSEPQLILVRCRRFEVQVSFDPFGGLSPLEEHLLLALAAGEASVDALAAGFGLPRRLVLDACVELLQAGLLVVDGKSLTPSPSVRTCIGPDLRHPSRDWARRLASAAPPEPETVVLLQELLSGSLIVPPQGPGFREPRPPEAPIHPEVPRLEDVAKLDLLLALGKVRAPRRDEDSRARSAHESRPSRIRDARIMRSVGAGAGALVSRDATIVVSLIARHDEVDGSSLPRFGVVGPDTIPTGVRRRMALALADLWERGHGRGPKQFFTRLSFAGQEGEGDSVQPTRHPRRVVRALAAAWEEARSKPPSEVHTHLEVLEREVSEELGELLVHRGRPEWRRGETHEACILEALTAAKQQVVIAAGDDLVVTDDLVDHVRAAAERGLTVFLVGEAAAEHEQKTPRFDGVARTSQGGGVFVSSGLMPSSARLVVCDLDWVRVACGSHSRGLRLAAHEPGRVASAVPKIVGWLRNQLADGRHKRQLLASPTLFGRRIDEVEVLAELPAPAPGPGPFEQLWRLAWAGRVEDHQRRLAESLPLAVPVFDGEHRELWDLGIHDAEQRFMIASAQGGSSPLPARLVAGLLEARDRGVDVRLVLDAESVPGPEVLHQCRELEARGARVERRSDPGCLLVCDDWCIVGSYRSLLPSSTQRHELSVRVFGDDVVDAVFAGE
jgi:hypothetical protein